MSKSAKETNLTFATLQFQEEYVISKIKEGVVVSNKEISDLIEICLNFYKTAPFVYISLRVNNYNVDPIIYIKLMEIPNLKGIAIASNRISSLKMASFEKNFSKVPYEIFTELPEAVEWAKERIKK